MIRINSYKMTFERDGSKRTKTITGMGNMKDIRKTAKEKGVKIISLKKINMSC